MVQFNLNILYSSKRILTYENMDIAPALKQIVDKLEFIANLNQKCNEIAVCCDLYAPEFSGKDEDIFSDFLDISNFGMDYEDGFEKYGITHVILYQDAKLNNSLKLDKNYKQIYSDKHFVIYERLK